MSAPYLSLLDYRRRVHQHYAHVRTSNMPIRERWRAWREARDELFASHPQSALDPGQRSSFQKLEYFPYDPALRFILDVDMQVEPRIFEIELEEDGLFRLRRLGKVYFRVVDAEVSLSLFWILSYGGGLFLPFRDGTNKSSQTYGGGRYLLDTIKGADLGREEGRLVLDFNFAYNPSCAYNPRWDCPLPPQENWLEAPIRGGELAHPDSDELAGH